MAGSKMSHPHQGAGPLHGLEPGADVGVVVSRLAADLVAGGPVVAARRRWSLVGGAEAGERRGAAADPWPWLLPELPDERASAFAYSHRDAPRFDSGRVSASAIAAPTGAGVWVPPGPSKYAMPVRRAGIWARNAPTS